MSSRIEQKAAARAQREAAERAEKARELRRKRVTRLLVALAVAAVSAVVLIVLATGGDEETAATGDGVAGVAEGRAMLEGIPQDGARLGDPDAKVVLTEFADLQCPFCRDYALQVLPQIIQDYVRPGDVALDLRLLRFIGPDSDRGARAALAAAGSDRMWEFVDLWYRNQGREGTGYADDEFIAGLAEAAGAPDAAKAAGSSAHEDAIAAGEQEAQANGIDSTPSFLLDGEPLSISQLEYGEFRKALDAALEK